MHHTDKFWGIAMSSEKDDILEFNQHLKSDQKSYMTFADIGSLIKKIDGCANNPKHYSAVKNR